MSTSNDSHDLAICGLTPLLPAIVRRSKFWVASGIETERNPLWAILQHLQPPRPPCRHLCRHDRGRKPDIRRVRARRPLRGPRDHGAPWGRHASAWTLRCAKTVMPPSTPPASTAPRCASRSTELGWRSRRTAPRGVRQGGDEGDDGLLRQGGFGPQGRPRERRSLRLLVRARGLLARGRGRDRLRVRSSKRVTRSRSDERRTHTDGPWTRPPEAKQ